MSSRAEFAGKFFVGGLIASVFLVAFGIMTMITTVVLLLVGAFFLGAAWGERWDVEPEEVETYTPGYHQVDPDPVPAHILARRTYVAKQMREQEYEDNPWPTAADAAEINGK